MFSLVAMSWLTCLSTLWQAAHMVTRSRPCSLADSSARTEESFVAISSFAMGYTPPQHCQSGSSSSSMPSAAAEARAYRSRSFAFVFSVQPG